MIETPVRYAIYRRVNKDGTIDYAYSKFRYQAIYRIFYGMSVITTVLTTTVDEVENTCNQLIADEKARQPLKSDVPVQKKETSDKPKRKRINEK